VAAVAVAIAAVAAVAAVVVAAAVAAGNTGKVQKKPGAIRAFFYPKLILVSRLLRESAAASASSRVISPA
jgi:hypothetical protein